MRGRLGDADSERQLRTPAQNASVIKQQHLRIYSEGVAFHIGLTSEDSFFDEELVRDGHGVIRQFVQLDDREHSRQ